MLQRSRGLDAEPQRGKKVVAGRRLTDDVVRGLQEAYAGRRLTDDVAAPSTFICCAQ